MRSPMKYLFPWQLRLAPTNRYVPYVIGYDKRGHFAHNIEWRYRPVKFQCSIQNVQACTSSNKNNSTTKCDIDLIQTLLCSSESPLRNDSRNSKIVFCFKCLFSNPVTYYVEIELIDCIHGNCQ
jgi:hypothetical protein